MSIVVYFHGYGSNGSSRTAKLIQDEYPNHTVVSCSYNTNNADEAIKSLDSFIKSTQLSYPDQKIILVGTSLGGFFANYFSNKLILPAILINPCLDPHIRLEKYNKHNIIVDCQSFLKYYTNDTHFDKLVILGVMDEIIPYHLFLDRFSSYKSVIFNLEMKHRVSDIQEIKSALSVYL